MGIIKNIGYKYRVLIAVTSFLIVAVMAFGTVFIKSYIDRNNELKISELAKDTENMMSSIESTLLTLHRYYLASESNAEVRYIVENDLDYSEVSAITEGTDTLSGNNIVSDYVAAYTLVNFKNNTVLGSRGKYSISEVVNIDELLEIYDAYKETYTKNIWVYIDEEAPDKNSRQYRMTVPIGGLDLILFAPYSEVSPYSLIIINVNMSQITSDLKKQLQENEEAALYTSDGTLIFATDQEIVRAVSENSFEFISKRDSSVAGLTLYVSYSNEGLEIFANTYQILGFILVVLLMLLVAVFVFYSIYKPVRSAAFEIASSNKEELMPGEDELRYLTDSVKRLDNKNEALIEHTTNLFAMRLYRNELTDEEIDQYIYRLSLAEKIPQNFRIQILVLKLINEDKVISGDDEKKICTKIIGEITENVDRKRHFLPPVYYSGAIVLFDDNEGDYKEKTVRNYNYLRQYIYDRYGMNIGIGVSSTYSDIHKVNAAYIESVKAVHHGKIDTGSFISYFSEEAEDAVKYDAGKEEELLKALRRGDKDAAYDIIDELFANFIGQKISRDGTIPILVQIVNSIVMEVQNSGIGMSVFREETRQIYSAIFDYHDLNRVRNYIKYNMIDPVIAHQNELIENQSGTIMAAIEQLVESKGGNITLNECSEILSYHTSYIWRILKEEKNMTFTEYIEQYKIREAKKLLTETDMTVGAIAERLNYTNSQNFIRFFNKMVGTTPGKYRQSARNNL